MNIFSRLYKKIEILIQKIILENLDFWLNTLIVLFLAYSGWKFTYGLENVIDIGLYDETFYLRNGVNLIKEGLPGPQAAPLYSIWYFFLSFTEPNRINLYYLNIKVLSITLPIMVYFTIQKNNATTIPAIIITFIFLISRANISVWPKVTHFSLILILISIILASQFKLFFGKLSVLIFGALLSSYVRPEFFVVFLVLFTICIVKYIQYFAHISRRENVILFFLTTLSILLIIVMGIPLSGNRSFIAFGQHFSLNWVKWTGENINSWTNWGDIVEINFGDAENFFEAFISNPSLVIKHLWTNFSNSFFVFVGMFLIHTSILLPDQLIYHETLIFVILIISLVIYFFLSIKGKVLLSRIMEIIRSEMAIPLFVICLYVFISMVSIILIFPREHYLLITGIMLIVIFSTFFIKDDKKNYNKNFRQILNVGLVLILITPNFISLYFPLNSRPNYNTIKFIESLDIKKDVNMLEIDGGYSTYLGDNFKYLPAHKIDSNCQNYFNNYEVNFVVLSSEFLRDPQILSDIECQNIIYNYSNYNFTKLSIPNTSIEILVDKDLLKK